MNIIDVISLNLISYPHLRFCNKIWPESNLRLNLLFFVQTQSKIIQFIIICIYTFKILNESMGSNNTHFLVTPPHPLEMQILFNIRSMYASISAFGCLYWQCFRYE